MIVTAGTAICTFLMVFTIQNSQNRHGLALQIKLDEIMRAPGAAQNGMINLGELSQQEIEDMKQKFAKIGKRTRKKGQKNQLLFSALLKDNSLVIQMYRSWINLMMLAAESQQVIWLRTMRLAAGGRKAKSETRRMVSEKVLVAGIEGGRMILGASPDSVVRRYRNKVKANIRRLSP